MFSLRAVWSLCSCVWVLSQVHLWDSMSGLPFPTPENLPNPRIELTSLASPALAGWFFTTAPPGKFLVLVKSLACGWKPIINFSGATVNSCKGLSDRPHEESCPLSRLGAQPMHCGLWKELQSTAQALPEGHVLMHFCIPRHLNFFNRDIWQRSFSAVSAKASLWKEGVKRETLLAQTLTFLYS